MRPSILLHGWICPAIVAQVVVHHDFECELPTKTIQGLNGPTPIAKALREWEDAADRARDYWGRGYLCVSSVFTGTSIQRILGIAVSAFMCSGKQEVEAAEKWQAWWNQQYPPIECDPRSDVDRFLEYATRRRDGKLKDSIAYLAIEEKILEVFD